MEAKKIKLPPKDSVEINYNQSIVFLGANGSGKSRLGAWIEQQNPKNVHRISAQRNLSFSEETPLRSYEMSKNYLLYGNLSEEESKYERWTNKRTTGLLNDYDHLLAMLFAEQNLRNEKLVKKVQNAIGQNIEKNFVPSSNIEKLVKVWNKLLPHRQIELSDQKINVKKDSISYKGVELSDGERVIIYLIGQVLSVESNFILIIDEPEIHIHKSIINVLWDELESLRVDISFFYITHDLDFAKERFGSKKIWVKSFDGQNVWEYQEIDFENDENFNQIHYEIMGARKPVLFVEGEKGSLDYKVYTKIYPKYTVIPVKSCETVIEMVSSYKKEWTLHDIAPVGIIDRDFRDDQDVQALKEKGIGVIDVKKIETLFTLPEVVNRVYELLSPKLHFKKTKEIVLSEVDSKIKNLFKNNVEQIIFKTTHKKLSSILSKFPKPSQSDKLSDKFTEYVNSIDIEDISKKIEEKLKEMEKNSDIIKMIQYIDSRNGLVKEISALMEMKKDRYINTVIKNLDDKHIQDAIFKFLPKLEVE